MSAKLSKMNVIDLNFKELFIISFCTIILVVFCYLPNFVF
jgi:hypothetical protein